MAPLAPPLLFLLLLLLTPLSSCTTIFTPSTLPASLSALCSTSLTSSIACSPLITGLRNGYYYTQRVLDSVCTAGCQLSLSAYITNVAAACADDTWAGYYDDETTPVAMLADLLQYQFDQACLADAGRYCNIVAAQAAGVDGSAPGSVAECDLCLVKKLRFLAGSPYYDGPLLAGVYAAKTASCGVTGYPLTTATLGYPRPTSTAESTPTPCAGETYRIQPGDDCASIAASRSISTAWLLADNSLAAFCADFPMAGTLCVVHTCSTYTVRADDTCDAIASAHGISVTQLLAWNPVLNAGCSNVARSAGSLICVGQPGAQYSPPSATTSAPGTTVAPLPSDVADGTNERCARFYRAVLGDYCNLLVMRFAISLPEFVFLNPAINSNCTNLYADESYCVQAVGDINTYSGRPGFATPTLTVPASIFTSLPDATFIPVPSTATELPFAPGSRTDCNWNIDGLDFQADWDGSMFASNCAAVAALYGVSVAVLATWNPSLAADTSCVFDLAYRYCALLPAAMAELPETPGTDTPIRDGASPTCTEFAPVYARMTCQALLDMYSLTIAQFFAYNPAVGADCSGLWLDYQYCIRTPEYTDETPTTTTTSTTTTPTSTPTPTAPSDPTQPGQPTNCNKWYTVQPGDWCALITSTLHLRDADFYAWNPAVAADCTSGLWAGYAYCVGTSSITATPTPTTAPTPSPTQDHSIAYNCSAFALALSGEYCALFAERHGVSLADLYAWNAVLGRQGVACGSMFWEGYYYCVGVGGA